MNPDPLRVAGWIDELSESSQVASESIEELRRYLDTRAARVASQVEPSLLPLRITKSRLAALDRCERLAVAEQSAWSEPKPLTPEMFRGLALDHMVTHQLVAGRVLDPPEVLRGMFAAQGDAELLDYMDQLDAHDDGQVGRILDPLATAVADGWAGVDNSWLARTQCRAVAVFNRGDVVCSGRLDVELGGAPTGRPGVVVEIKSGQPRQEHLAEMYFYALLVALRDRVAPVAMLRWYPGAAPAIDPVSEGVLNSVAVRVGDALEAWAELVSGAASGPAESPGVWCQWCPDGDVCPSSMVGRP